MLPNWTQNDPPPDEVWGQIKASKMGTTYKPRARSASATHIRPEHTIVPPVPAPASGTFTISGPPKLDRSLDEYPSIIDILTQMDERDKSAQPRNFMQFGEVLIGQGAETIGELLFMIREQTPDLTTSQALVSLAANADEPIVMKPFVASVISDAFRKAALQVESMTS